MKVFFDSSYWVALYYTNDRFHEDAKKLDILLPKNAELFINPLIVYESLTIIAMREDKKTAINFGKYIFGGTNSGVMRSIRVDEYREKETWKIFSNIQKKDISFIDCSILASLKEFSISTLFTFDNHFKSFAKEYSFKINQF